MTTDERFGRQGQEERLIVNREIRTGYGRDTYST